MAAAASDDEASAEGGALRSLFAGDASSASTTSSREDEDDRTDPVDFLDGDPDGEYETRQHLHVLVRQRRERGSIAQRLWPAARRLAAFVLAQREDLLSQWSSGGGAGDDGRDGDGAIPIVELGAGVGLTGLELASQLPARVLLTDLADAVPLLQSNVQLNGDRFLLGPDAVQVQPLEWGDPEQADAALTWFRTVRSRDTMPLLVIGSDCVYWPCLHEPLEVALSQILSQAPRGSMCLLAGMRRWKSDTRFFKTLGKRMATATHRLKVECVNETVERMDTGRDITRIYKIQWLEKNG